MRIDYIKINNYRQYKDPREIDFSNPDKKKNFIIIEGATGAGKSNLFNAVTWCLYGREIHLKDSAKGLPKLNTITYNESSVDKLLYVEVEMQMTDETERKTYKVKRKAMYQKRAGNLIDKVDYDSQEVDGSEFKIYELKKNDWKELSHPSSFISRFMPESIMEYFFFDGEQLDEYFKDISGEKIKKAIFDISKLELLERVIQNLESVKKDLLYQERNKLSEKTVELEKELVACDTKIQKLASDINDTKNSIKEAEKNLRTVSKKLKELSPEQVKQLAKKRDENKSRLKQIEGKIDEQLYEINRRIIEIAPVIYSQQAIKKTSELIGEEESLGSIPPKYQKNFIESLLKDGACICGTDLKANKGCRKKLAKLFDECPAISDISSEITNIGANNKSLTKDIKSFKQDILKLNSEYQEIDNKRKDLIEDIEELDKKLAGINDEDIKETESYYQELDKTIRDEHVKLGELKNKLEESEKSKKELEKGLSQELKKKKELRSVAEKRTFCDQSIDVALRVKDEIMQKIRCDIERRTKLQFAELHWKRESLDIKIDSDYNVCVFDQFRRDTLDTLSAGERQLLALSFMAALNNVSGFKSPILIDTPLGRLAGEPKENIATNLPNYLKDRQVILLVTDQEYTKEVRDKLSQRVGKEYKIFFEETSQGNQSEIEPY